MKHLCSLSLSSAPCFADCCAETEMNALESGGREREVLAFLLAIYRQFSAAAAVPRVPQQLMILIIHGPHVLPNTLGA